MVESTSEATLDAGLAYNAEMIKNFYTFMVFDTGAVTEEDLVPVNEALRKSVVTTRDGANLEFTGQVDIGDFTVDTTITAIWICGVSGEDDIFLVRHILSGAIVGPATGLIYTAPYSISGFDEEYES
ncbi:MAG: hypothetical protein JXQ82_07600 [Methanomicrobiaceae archaeon]|nr:hypothetical protein [Methanomicrobiaceae archaeon]